MTEYIQVFDSQGEAYKRAFQIFLDNTDQKRNAKRDAGAQFQAEPGTNPAGRFFCPATH